ncbi:MAG TPA: HAD-IIA family hydrolase [Anaerolineae bacterium]|nr:HAD-IIA family hydrolase [Anaerolineae bacterium]
MDGVLWRGQEPMPGLVEFIRFLRDRSIKFVCATNNASMLAEKLAERLQGWGADVRPDEIVTSSTATADYLTTILLPGSRLYVIGMEGLRAPLLERGFEFADRDAVVCDVAARNAAAVVVGIDWNVTYHQFKQAALLIRAGAKFIGTNSDRTFPTPEGIVPGNGSLLALIETATDVKPIVIGKPEPVLYEMSLKRMNAVPDQTLVLGDRLETDILGAVRLNLKSALVLSGVTTRAELAASDYQPDWVFDDIADLTRQWAMSNAQFTMHNAQLPIDQFTSYPMAQSLS